MSFLFIFPFSWQTSESLVELLLLLQVAFECGVRAVKAGDFPGDPCSMSPF